jgi:type IV secretory pathway VirB2 component (pilin)
MGPLAIAGAVIGVILAFLWSFGAARLSYLKYGSIGWAILDFFFASFYYPFYAFFLAEGTAPSVPMMGGRRRLKLW